MQDDVYNAYHLFKIPELETQSGKKKVVIGLIDASGSMGSFWKEMVKFWNQSIAPSAQFLITFSQKAKLEENTILSEELKQHGGGMTNIYAAFEAMEERLISFPENSSITLVFISDGQDTVNGEKKLINSLKNLRGGQGRDITFLCLGIQSGFPTSISMKLRQLYHTGEETIPAIYLIEYASEKAFFNKFETMSNCFRPANSIKVPNAGEYIKEYPWQENGQADVKQGKWLMVHKEFPEIQVIYNDNHKFFYAVTTLEKLSIDELVDCFRGWLQKIQLLSMDNKKMNQTQKIASKTAEIIRAYTKEFQKINKIYIISDKPVLEKETFKERAMALAVKNTGSRVKWFIDQLMIIAKGVGLGQLNEYEAAKRIGIGTITGKYHQKALALKGITVKDFTIIKDEFAEIFKQVKLSKQPSKQQCSIFTLQNQKEVFQEQDFLQGLNFCKTQFDLVESFPLVGYGLKVKRYDGSMINPWKVRLQQLAKTHKTIDSAYLARNSNKYELSIGQNQIEEINAVLPLFGLEDAEMSELFNTRLFKLAISFMVVQNIDTYHEQAYLALLGATLAFLVKQPKSEWRNNLINQIYTSLKVTVGANGSFRKFIIDIQKNPYSLFVAKQKEDHVDITKVMLIVFYIWKEANLPKKQINHLVDLALVHYTEKTYIEKQFKIFSVADVVIGQKQQQMFNHKKKEQEMENLQKINTIKNDAQLKALVSEKTKNIVNTDHIKVTLTDKIFLHEDEDRRVTYSNISNFYKLIKDQELQKEEILFYFGHFLKGKTQMNYTKPIVKDMNDLKKTVLMKIDLKQLGSGNEMKKMKKKMEQVQLDHFRATHFGILPFTQNRLTEVCKNRNINKNIFHLNQSTGMIKNTCMSPNCLYYMQPMQNKELIDHMRLWRGQMPARFHMTVVNQIRSKKTAEQICQFLFSSKMINIKKHKKNNNYVLQYIVQIQESLSK